jgi:hypothetical protein
MSKSERLVYEGTRVQMHRFDGSPSRGRCVEISTREETPEGHRLEGVELNQAEAKAVARKLNDFDIWHDEPGDVGDDKEGRARRYFFAYDRVAELEDLLKEAKEKKEEAKEAALKVFKKGDAIVLAGRRLGYRKDFRVQVRPEAYELENVDGFLLELATQGVIPKPNWKALVSAWREGWEEGKAVPEKLKPYLTAQEVPGLTVRKAAK